MDKPSKVRVSIFLDPKEVKALTKKFGKASTAIRYLVTRELENAKTHPA